jgi:hypothetical protein
MMGLFLRYQGVELSRRGVAWRGVAWRGVAVYIVLSGALPLVAVALRFLRYGRSSSSSE